MAYQRQPHQPEGALGPPVPSGAMYIGLCQTRAQAAALRWQYAVVFMALNGVVGSVCFNYIDYHKAGRMFPIAIIALFMLAGNGLFRGLVNRANQWIDYFTVLIERIENAVGTESGIRTFSDPNYLSKEATQPLVRGLRFRHGIRALSDSMLLIWGGVFLGCVSWGAYLAGQNSW